MFGIGETELVIIVVFGFLLFGPDKLPGMGRTLGRMLRQFREASDGFTEVVQSNIMDPASEELEAPDKSPKQRKREAAEAMGEDTGEAAEGTQAAVAPKRETFAERKARLMAERRAAAEAAQAADAAPAEQAGPVSATEPVGGQSVQTNEVPAVKQTEPARMTAADLYGTGQRSSRSRSQEGSADAEPKTTQAGAQKPVATTHGEEAGEA